MILDESIALLTKEQRRLYAESILEKVSSVDSEELPRNAQRALDIIWFKRTTQQERWVPTNLELFQLRFLDKYVFEPLGL